MPLLLTEADVKSILTMPLALEAVEDSFRRLADGAAVSHSRQRLHIPGKGYLHYMAASDVAGGYFGLKIYSASREGMRFLVPLYSAASGELVALIEADYLGQVRTGAASGVAHRMLAEVVASQTRSSPGPCSACANMSAAMNFGFAVSSASTNSSLGPGSKSIATCPTSSRLAVTT